MPPRWLPQSEGLYYPANVPQSAKLSSPSKDPTKPSPPRVFIGSSTEGHRIAELIQLGLDSAAECTIWSQGVFGLSGITLEKLCETARTFDFAVLVLTPDDLLHKRTSTVRVARDNVLFELGLFMGTLGRDATFIVHGTQNGPDLPSDLAGVTTAQWRPRTDGNMQAALGPVCTKLRLAIESLAPRSARLTAQPSELEKLRETLQAQSRDFLHLVETINKSLGLQIREPLRNGSTDQLKFLEGTWRNIYGGSTYYIRIVNGRVYCPYCYIGNDELTGEYYDWSRTGDVLTAKFRWFENNGPSGYIYLQIESEDRLVGGWWSEGDVPPAAFERLPLVKGMVRSRWERIKPGPVPPWVSRYYDALPRR
jgi:predicted nucleotide-binding protein